MNNMKRVIEQMQIENNDLSDMAGDACGEALLFRRALEWIAYNCEPRVEAKMLALNVLRAAGYSAATDALQLAAIL